MSEEIKTDSNTEQTEIKTESATQNTQSEASVAPVAEKKEERSSSETPAQTDKPKVETRTSSGSGDNQNRQRSDRPRQEGSDNRPRKDYRQRNEGGSQRMPRFKRKVCKFCYDKNLPIDYKRPDILEKFITDRGKILPRRVTGTCAKHQRAIARSIKQARTIAFLPFIEK